MSSNEKNTQNQVIALAAVAQAAALIDRLARTGYDDKEACKVLVYGLLQTNPSSTTAVYVAPQKLQLGIHVLRQLLQQGGQRPDNNYNYSEVMRYCLSMLHLERKLRANPQMLDTIGARIEQTRGQVEHFRPIDTNEPLHNGLIHESVLAGIASIYSDTLSTLRFRVQVNGNPAHLQQEIVIHKIRSLLLCGIRAAVLWKQVGGSRMGLLFRRKEHMQIISQMV